MIAISVTLLLPRGEHLVVVMCLLVLNRLKNSNMATTTKKKQDNAVDGGCTGYMYKYMTENNDQVYQSQLEFILNVGRN